MRLNVLFLECLVRDAAHAGQHRLDALVRISTDITIVDEVCRRSDVESNGIRLFNDQVYVTDGHRPALSRRFDAGLITQLSFDPQVVRRFAL